MPKISSGLHDLRSNGGYARYPNYGVKFQNSFFPHFSRSWNSLPKNVKIIFFIDFKKQIALRLKPTKYKHFQGGPTFGNISNTKIRDGRSSPLCQLSTSHQVPLQPAPIDWYLSWQKEGDIEGNFK